MANNKNSNSNGLDITQKFIETNNLNLNIVEWGGENYQISYYTP